MKKNILKITSVMLVLTLFALMAIGSGGSDEKKPITDTTTEADGTAGESNAPDTTEEKKQPDGDVTIEESVLVDENGVVITAKEYVKDSIFGDGIKLLLENNTDKDLGFTVDALIVNDYMISDLFSASVPAGKKANETMNLSSSALEAAGIDVVGKIEVYFRLYDSDSYETVFEPECVTIKTSAYDSMDITPNDTGKELFNSNGIRIVGKYVDEGSFWGAGVLVYIENKSGQNITVQCEDMSVNGFAVSPVFSCDVKDGKMAIDDITIFSSDLEENDITSVEDIELKFHIFNADTWDTIVDSDAIAFSAK